MDPCIYVDQSPPTSYLKPITKVYIIVFLSILQAEVILPPENLENWETLQDGKIWVGWKHSRGIDWCRSKTILEAPLADIQKSIEDAENYPKIMLVLILYMNQSPLGQLFTT